MSEASLIPKLADETSRFGATPEMVLVTTSSSGEGIEIGDPVSQAKIYEAQAADELIFVGSGCLGGQSEAMVE